MAPIPRSVSKRRRKPCPSQKSNQPQISQMNTDYLGSTRASRVGFGASPKQILSLLAVGLCLFSLPARAEKISLVGGTVINPADGKVLPNATVVIDGDKIERVAIGKQDAASLGKQIDCSGKFILPGYVDTHIHFFQSGDLFTRPDGADLNSVRSYKDEVAWVKSHLNDVFARYLRCGITSVVDVGGPFWTFGVRKTGNATATAPRGGVAGPLISSVSRNNVDPRG